MPRYEPLMPRGTVVRELPRQRRKPRTGRVLAHDPVSGSVKVRFRGRLQGVWYPGWNLRKVK
jgi:hypothetical protein